MKSHSAALATSLLSLGFSIPAWLGMTLPSFGHPHLNGLLLANRRAADICIHAVENQGLQVLDMLDQNEYAGGAEVVLRVRQRRQSFALGCDYAENTGRVQLYPLGRYEENGEEDWQEGWGENRRQNWRGDQREGWQEERRENWERDDEFYDRDFYNDRVSDSWQAEEIARRTIENQLGVDANSGIIQIENTRRADQRWRVNGQVNGAPFEVWIRRDGSVEDFQLR